MKPFLSPLILGRHNEINRFVEAIGGIETEPPTPVVHSARLFGIPIMMSSRVPENEIWIRNAAGKILKVTLHDDGKIIAELFSRERKADGSNESDHE